MGLAAPAGAEAPGGAVGAASTPKALQVKSVEVIGTSAGLIVRMRMKANLEKAIGKDDLKNAVAGLVIKPTNGKPLGLFTTGAKPTTLRSKALKRARVLREGRELTLLVPGYSVDKVKKLALGAANPPATAKRTAQAADGLDDLGKAIEKVLDAGGTETLTSEQIKKILDCDDARKELVLARQRHLGALAIVRERFKAAAEAKAELDRAKALLDTAKRRNDPLVQKFADNVKAKQRAFDRAQGAIDFASDEVSTFFRLVKGLEQALASPECNPKPATTTPPVLPVTPPGGGGGGGGGTPPAGATNAFTSKDGPLVFFTVTPSGAADRIRITPNGRTAVSCGGAAGLPASTTACNPDGVRVVYTGTYTAGTAYSGRFSTTPNPDTNMGGTVEFSNDGGATWSAPITMTGPP